MRRIPWVPSGPTSPFDVVGPRCLGPRREDLEVEVTPTQLPQEGFRAGPADESGLDVERGETAEVQVPRETGGGGLGEVVPVLAVAGDRSSSPGRKPSSRRRARPPADGGREWRRGESRRGPGPGASGPVPSTVGSEVGGGGGAGAGW